MKEQTNLRVFFGGCIILLSIAASAQLGIHEQTIFGYIMFFVGVVVGLILMTPLIKRLEGSDIAVNFKRYEDLS